MTVHADLSSPEQLLVMAALEDGLTLGPMRVTYTDARDGQAQRLSQMD